MPNVPSLKRGRCPQCGREFEYRSIAEHKCFPFCSDRCRDVDLGKWLTGAYAIPGEDVSDEAASPEPTPEHDAT